jgi:hypothetical protein
VAAHPHLQIRECVCVCRCVCVCVWMHYIHPYLTNPAAAGGTKSLDSIDFMLLHLVSVVGPLDNGHGFSGVYSVRLYPVPLHNNKIVHKNLLSQTQFLHWFIRLYSILCPWRFRTNFWYKTKQIGLHQKLKLFYTTHDFGRNWPGKFWLFFFSTNENLYKNKKSTHLEISDAFDLVRLAVNVALVWLHHFLIFFFVFFTIDVALIWLHHLLYIYIHK